MITLAIFMLVQLKKSQDSISLMFIHHMCVGHYSDRYNDIHSIRVTPSHFINVALGVRRGSRHYKNGDNRSVLFVIVNKIARTSCINNHRSYLLQLTRKEFNEYENI